MRYQRAITLILSISSVDTSAMLLAESIGTPFAAESVTQADMISISQGLMLHSGTVIVTVKQSSPAPEMMVTEAFTYPNCIITFSHEPSDGIIIQSPSGKEFERLGND